METSEIFASLKVNEEMKRAFDGVYPIDMLPEKHQVNYDKYGQAYMVVNLDPHYKTGSHWVSLCISPNDDLYDEYFDSYGQEPPKIVREYLGNNYLWQCKQLQNDLSTICGQWCMFYIREKCRKRALTEIVGTFPGKDTLENDKKVNAIVNREFDAPPHGIVDTSFLTKQVARMLREMEAQRHS